MTTLAARPSAHTPPSDLEAFRARLDPARMPRHVAIIMDGNGRWARKHHLPSRLLGHREGYKTVRRIVRDAAELSIPVLTLYVFSNENWRRPKHETDGLMALIEQAARNELRELHENGVRIRFVGRREGLSESLAARDGPGHGSHGEQLTGSRSTSPSTTAGGRRSPTPPGVWPRPPRAARSTPRTSPRTTCPPTCTRPTCPTPTC